ncbi:MAG: hypothetical protein WCE52_22435 [Candidatus Acidiferrum sp.]
MAIWHLTCKLCSRSFDYARLGLSSSHYFAPSDPQSTPSGFICACPYCHCTFIYQRHELTLPKPSCTIPSIVAGLFNAALATRVRGFHSTKTPRLSSR